MPVCFLIAAGMVKRHLQQLALEQAFPTARAASSSDVTRGIPPATRVPRVRVKRFWA
jgi:hypothetical protein